MATRYAVIGWGSLIWDLDDLAPKVEGPWHLRAGPRLPLEFTRISPKRKQSLVVVVNAEYGRPCPTHVIASRRGTLAEAIADLAARERTTEAGIGGVCLNSGVRQNSDLRVAELVAEWCTASGWDGAVWTDLPSNFAAETGEPFTLETAVAYLKTLTWESLDEALRYIESAPAETDTPLRRRLAADPWWRAEAARRGLSATPPPAAETSGNS